MSHTYFPDKTYQPVGRLESKECEVSAAGV